jgi:K+-sensing histidine kinase KdpD
VIKEVTIERRNTAMAPRALLRVRDFGPGVPPRMLTEIFVPFRRGQEQPESEPHGAGLGLAIADRVVRIHDGAVHAENAKDGGLIVVMELPLVNTSASRPGL